MRKSRLKAPPHRPLWPTITASHGSWTVSSNTIGLPCLRELAPICEGLQDTVSLAYTDIFVADLAFLASVRQAARRGVSGADTIYNDLKERFPGRPPAPPVPPGGGTPSNP